MGENATLVCMRVEPGIIVAAGSVQEKCVGCGHPVWTSPASRKQVSAGERNVSYACITCAPALLEEATVREPTTFEPPSAEVLKEVLSAFQEKP